MFLNFSKKSQTELQQKLEEASKRQHNKEIEAQNKLTEMTAKQQHDTNIVEQLKTIVFDRELKVTVLEYEIQQLKLAVSNMSCMTSYKKVPSKKNFFFKLLNVHV